MGKLRMMMDKEVERQNESAHGRLMFARLNRRVPSNIVFDLSSDPEDNREEEAAAPPQTTQNPTPHLCLRPLARTQPPLENRGAEGPLQDPGPNPSLERPEVGREMEEKLTHPHANGAIEPPLNLGPNRQAPGEESTGDDEVWQVERGWWDDQDKEKWTPELVSAFDGFARGRTWGGEQWQTCVSLLVEFEKTTGFQNKGKLKAPDKKGERPVEFADFMQLRRQWDTPFALQTEIGPRTLKDSFAQRWWMWWELGQPAERLETENKWLAPAELDSEDWGDMRKRYSRNGMLLYVGGLFWWGEAVKDDERATELLAK
jgi:hypothetical protein